MTDFLSTLASDMEQVAFESICIVGIILAATLYLYKIQKLWCHVYGRKVVYLTGWIGTPIHEIAHALVCKLFGMKVTEISFFNPDPETGVLGYVNFSYNPRSPIQSAGRFYVGIAPLFANLSLAYAALLLIPQSPGNWEEWGIWIGGVYTAIALSMHAAPSPADLRGSFWGGISLALIMTGVFYFIPWLVEIPVTWIYETLIALTPTVFLMTLPLPLAAAVSLLIKKATSKA